MRLLSEDEFSHDPGGSPTGFSPAHVSALLDWLGAPVSAAMRTGFATVRADTTLLAAVAVLRASDAGAAVVVDENGTAIGLLDAEDILRRVVFESQPGSPVSRVMQVSSALCDNGDLLHRETARMQREGRRALGVCDSDGKPVGLLRADFACAPLLAPAATFLAIQEEDSGAEARAQLAAALVQDGQDAVALQHTLATLNDDLMRRIAQKIIGEMEADGWGPPPVRFALIIMGSGGRRESFLHPDQDNGLVLEAYPDEEHAAIDPYFIAFSDRLTRRFDHAGFPLCTGNVMATNPLWRKTLQQWVAQVELWALRRSPQAVLSSDIFLDFRPIFGAVELGEALRREVLRIAASYPAFIRQISWQQASEGGPIGLLGSIHPDSRESRLLDLKLHGTLPLVGMVRFLALRYGIGATGTLERLRALAGAGQISPSLHAALADDFGVLTDFRLRQQIADMQAGRSIGNRLALDALSERERARLIQVFRTIETLRKSAAREFGGQAG